MASNRSERAAVAPGRGGPTEQGFGGATYRGLAYEGGYRNE